MIKSIIKATIEQCTRWPWLVLALSLALAALAGLYTVNNFAITTDISKLISPNLPWRQREVAFNKAFPQSSNIILAVVDGPTSEAASQATLSLSHALEQQKSLFSAVDPVSETPFFAHSAFLFPPVDQVAALTGKLSQAAPLIRQMAHDPSLRGLSRALQFGIMGVAGEGGSLAPLATVLDTASSTVENALADKPAYFSWRSVVSGEPASTGDLRRFIVIHPKLDFAALEPGQKASEAIRATAARLHLKENLGATVRLTGSVPISDEEFRTIQEGAVP
ncbi:MAG TPA: hopanoid biosynthesis-associated RND transporter HpnN, partial [Pseudolabrys sp.]|nr:hopanoid biosynthesis-associated RND transporter HpnN [Pseudolabrys sp.]